MSATSTTTPTDTAALIRARHDDLGFDDLADTELVATIAEHLAVPREQPADSFVLHAPLELTARASLLPFVRPPARARARLRLTSLLDGYERTGPGLAPHGTTTPGRTPASVLDAATALIGAVADGDLAATDDAAAWLGTHATPAELRHRLAGDVLPRLAAAAHAPIFLYHLPRVAPRGEVTGGLLRGLARELARQPEWRLHWISDDRHDGPPAADLAPGAMFDALASTPREPDPPRSFIFPTMAHVDQNGTAAALLRPVTDLRAVDATAVPTTVATRGREVLQAAAWSMLLEPDDHAPYGWSHCLTLPQAALGVAGAIAAPADALAVAATYVVGFRSSLARRPLVPVFDRPDPGIDLRRALDDQPESAAAAVWHAPAPHTPEIVSDLATHAATQHDAHLVKYTLACIDAAAGDPAHARLFLAAAAHLNGWWIRHGNPDDPFTR
jgi:hypothetical protein